MCLCCIAHDLSLTTQSNPINGDALPLQWRVDCYDGAGVLV